MKFIQMWDIFEMKQGSLKFSIFLQLQDGVFPSLQNNPKIYRSNLQDESSCFGFLEGKKAIPEQNFLRLI